MQEQDLVATQVYETKDYEKFILDDKFNRAVNELHVKKLIKCYQKIGDYGIGFPIIVDPKFKIIDGQHRFTARMKLGLIIYYIKTNSITSDKLGEINANVLKWKIADYHKAGNSKIVQHLRKLKDGLKSEFTLSTFLAALSVTKQDLITENEVKYKRILEQTLRIKPYLIYLQENITNQLTSVNTSKDKHGLTSIRDLISLSIKMATQGVYIEDLPLKVTYVNLLGWLKAKNYKV